MKNLPWFSALAVCALATIGHGADFPANVFSSGVQSSIVDSTKAPSGPLAIEAKGDGYVALQGKATSDSPVFFASFQIQPNVAADWENGTIVQIGGAALAYQLTQTRDGHPQARLVAVDLSKGVYGRAIAFITPDPLKHRVTAFQKIVLRIDKRTSTWDVFVDGNLISPDLPLQSSANGAVMMFPGRGAAAIIANPALTNTNPLFSDSNGNGIPDDFETQFESHLEPGPRDPRLLRAYLDDIARRLAPPTK